jgi:hypothetical protein
MENLVDNGDRRAAMQTSHMEEITKRILQDAGGKFLFPYQVFRRIKELDPSLARRIETAYPTEQGNPIMGEGGRISFSPASFIAHALGVLAETCSQVREEWLDATDIEIEGILPGEVDATSIWAWKEQ